MKPSRTEFYAFSNYKCTAFVSVKDQRGTLSVDKLWHWEKIDDDKSRKGVF